jgi:hypothetical protein
MDYSKGKIYVLYSEKNQLFYYGSTINSLERRFSGHKCKPTKASKKIILCEDAKIKLIENYPCKNKEELNRREGEYIKKNCCVNMKIAGQTDQEYRNMESTKKRRSEYYKKNKQKLDLKTKIWNEENKEHRKNYKKIWNKKKQNCQYCKKEYTNPNIRNHERKCILKISN